MGEDDRGNRKKKGAAATAAADKKTDTPTKVIIFWRSIYIERKNEIEILVASQA